MEGHEALTINTRLLLGVLLLAGAVSACAQPAATVPVATHPPPTAIKATALPPIQVHSFTLTQDPNNGGWRVVGLVENRGISAFEGVELEVTLLGAAGEQLAQATVPTFLNTLVPDELSPFVARIDSTAAVAEAQVEVVGFGPSRAKRAEVEVQIDEFFTIETGELAVIGHLTNSGIGPVRISSLALLAAGPASDPIMLMPAVTWKRTLGPSESAPFMGLAPADPGPARWTAYHDAVGQDRPMELGIQLVGEAELQFTAQGAPFVVGSLINSGPRPAVGAVLLTLYEGSRIVSLLNVEPPVALPPAEVVSFSAFGFPGLALRSSDPIAFRIEAQIDTLEPVKPESRIALPLDISTFHSVGSALFIRGQVRAPADSPIESATVFAEVRSSSGDLQTAGWAVVDHLGPGSEADFVIELPLPEGFEDTLPEYDLRAIGLKAQP